MIRFRRIPRRLRVRLEEHRRRSARLLSHLRHDWSTTFDLERRDSWRVLESEARASQVAVFVACFAGTRELVQGFEGHVVSALARRRLPFERDDVDLLFRLAGDSRTDWTLLQRLAWATGAAEAYAERVGDTAEIGDVLRDALRFVERGGEQSAERNRLRARLRKLLPAAAGRTVDLSLVQDDDWGERVRAEIRARFADERVVADLLLHLAQATSGPRPKRAWMGRFSELVEQSPALAELVKAMLEHALVAEHRTRPMRLLEERYLLSTWITGGNAVLMRGAVWAAGQLPEPWVPELVARVAEHAATPPEKGFDERSLVVANAAVRTLAELEPGPAVEPLTRLRATIKHRGIRKQIERALEDAAARAGMTKAQLVETAVERHGLDDEARREEALGEYAAILEVRSPGDAALVFRNPQGKPVKSLPAAVRERHADELKRLRTELKEIKKTVAAERLRLESLLAEDRTWSYEDWERLYLAHPVTGALARSLIWIVGGVAVLPRAGELIEASGRAAAPRGDVRLWHPLDAQPGEIADWRRFLLEEQIVQVYKQAYRESYVVAPAELETRTYSNRFAGHVLRYPQVYALTKQRRWTGNALGPWDGGFEGVVRREFDGVEAHFYIDAVEEENEGPLASFCTTDQVRFVRVGGPAEPMPVGEIPPRVFSEAMRDVDLFVSVASIGADPEWEDRGEQRWRDYWQEFAFSRELTESAQTRREVLRELVPRLAIADRCEVGDRFLKVWGDRGVYNIHLGSGNVLMEPDGRFLCIVPARGEKAPRVFLPFEDDARLNVILSKAFLLANDTKIRDRTILAQMRQ